MRKYGKPCVASAIACRVSSPQMRRTLSPPHAQCTHHYNKCLCISNEVFCNLFNLFFFILTFSRNTLSPCASCELVSLSLFGVPDFNAISYVCEQSNSRGVTAPFGGRQCAEIESTKKIDGPTLATAAVTRLPLLLHCTVRKQQQQQQQATSTQNWPA